MEEVPEDEDHMWELLKDRSQEPGGDSWEIQDPRGREFKERSRRKARIYAGHLSTLSRARSPKVIASRQKLEDKVKELLATASVDESPDRNGSYDL